MQRQAGEIFHSGHLHEPVHQDVPREATQQKWIIINVKVGHYTITKMSNSVTMAKFELEICPKAMCCVHRDTFDWHTSAADVSIALPWCHYRMLQWWKRCESSQWQTTTFSCQERYLMVSLMPCLRMPWVQCRDAELDKLKSWATKSEQAFDSKPSGFPLLHTLAKESWRSKEMN